MLIYKYNLEGIDTIKHPRFKSLFAGLKVFIAVLIKAFPYTYFMLASCLAYNSSLKLKAVCPFEMLVEVQWTIWRYSTGDRSLRVFCCLKPFYHSVPHCNSFSSSGVDQFLVLHI
jgi:hypothetical protein